MADDDDCDRCMFEWPGISCCSGERYGDRKGLFLLWENTKFLEARREIAAQIRDLPVRNRSHREEAGK